MVDGAELHRAEHLIDLGRSREAEPMIRAYLAHEPESGRATCLLVQVLLDEDRHDEAVTAAKAAVRVDPENEHPHRLLAIAYLGTKRPDLAISAAQESVRLAPHQWQAHYTLGMALLRTEQAARGSALTSAREAARLAPYESAPHNLIGLCLRDLKRRDLARDSFREALRINPGNALAMNNLAAMDIDSGRLSRASSLLRSGLSADPQENLLHRNYDTVLLMLVRRLYLALIATAVALVLMATGEAPYAARVATTVTLLAIYAAATYLVTRNLPRGAHLWARGLLGRIQGGQTVLVFSFLGFTGLVIALGTLPTRTVASINITAILFARLLFVAAGAGIAAARRRKRLPNLRKDLPPNDSRKR